VDVAPGSVCRARSDKITPFVRPASAMPSATPSLSLAFDHTFADLYERSGLVRIDASFAKWLAQADAPLFERFTALRAGPVALAYKEEADFLLALAPHLDRFIAELFGIREQWEELVESHHRLAPLFRVKRKFVQRRAMLKIKPDVADAFDGPALEAQVAKLLGGAFDELVFAERIL
jgi:hypothetical protein